MPACQGDNGDAHPRSESGSVDADWLPAEARQRRALATRGSRRGPPPELRSHQALGRNPAIPDLLAPLLEQGATGRRRGRSLLRERPCASVCKDEER